MLDLEALADRTAEIVRDHVERAVSPLRQRIRSLEERSLERGEKGEPGLHGAPGRDGLDGRDGKDGIGNDGNDGANGLDGRDGTNGRDGLDGAPGPTGQEGPAGKQGEQGPAGERGECGKDGPPGCDGEAGAPGERGRDGIGAGGAVIDRDGCLVLTMTDGTIHKLGQVVGRDGLDGTTGKDGNNGTNGLDGTAGKDGRDGAAGRDGFGFDDLSFDYDGERSFVFRFARGDHTKEFPFSMPVVIDRGVFKADQGYSAGDAVTWAGSLWIAKAETYTKPGDGEGWRLAVKKGRDGKDASASVAGR